MGHSETRTKALFEAKYLKARYRLGRRLGAGVEVWIEGCAPIRFEADDRTLDRAGLTFGQLPRAFQEGILERVRKELGGEYVPTLLPGDRVLPESVTTP